MIPSLVVGLAILVTGMLCLALNGAWIFEVLDKNNNEKIIVARLARYCGFIFLWLCIWHGCAFYEVDKTLVELRTESKFEYPSQYEDFVRLPNGSIHLLNERYKKSFRPGEPVWTYQYGSKYGIDFGGFYSLFWQKPETKVKEGKLQFVPESKWKIVYDNE